jgi:ABC-type siderophore export system fused ATPase/permease subunit
MTFPGNGTTKKIIATVVAALCLFLVTQVLINSNRITAAETEIRTIKEGIIASRAETQMNRVENREEHRIITAKLDEIAKEVRK